MNSSKNGQELIHSIDCFATTMLLNDLQHYLLLEGALLSSDDEHLLHSFLCVTKISWVYAGTEFNEEQENGPLLVRVNNTKYDYKELIQKVIEQWIPQQSCILLALDPNIQEYELIYQLQMLRSVELQGLDPAQKILFRWYEPRSLFALISSLTQQEIKNTLGCISEVIWCHYIFDQAYWYRTINPEPIPITKIHYPILISQACLTSMGEYDLNFYAQSMARELIVTYPEINQSVQEITFKKEVKNQVIQCLNRGLLTRNEIKNYIYLALKNQYKTATTLPNKNTQKSDI